MSVEDRDTGAEASPERLAERRDGSATSHTGDGGHFDFRAIFESAPALELVLAPDPPKFTMLAATDEWFSVTLSARDSTLGRPLFDVFPTPTPRTPSRVARRTSARGRDAARRQ